MPLLSFEGVEVHVPSALHGVRFAFANGSLSIECTNFSGAIVMAKPTAADKAADAGLAMALSDFPTPVHSTDSPSGSDQQLIVQATQTSSLSSLSSGSKKRSIPDEQDDPDATMESSESERESDLLRKRVRPNFLNDVEQTMLLAQLEASQQSQQASSPELVEPTQAEPAKATSASPVVKPREKETPSPSDLKTPAKAKKATTVSHMKSFFSPEPKELATKKSSDSATKRSASRPSSAKTKSETTQISIRDMMFQAAPTKAPVVQAPPPTASWSILETSGAVPAERWGHTVTKISDDRLVVYGGADDDEATLGDLHVFDLAKNTWSKPINCESIPRTWHDAVYLESKHLLLVFGGERAVGDDQLDVLSDIMVLDTECFLWYPPAVSGVTPAARSGHTCTVVGNDVVVFGGSRGRNRQSSVHVLDSDSWHWKTVKVEGKPPSARTYHSAVAVGNNSVVYFGGNDSKKSFDSVHVLKKSEGKDDVWSWFHPCVMGKAPRARTGHSATLVDDSKILIFGGWDPQSGDGSATTNVFDDAFMLNTVTWEWETVELKPQAADETSPSLPGRVGHSAVLGKDKTVLLFGGQDAKEQRQNVVHALSFSKPPAASQNSSTPESSVGIPATQASA